MANTKSAKKAVRQSIRKRAQNLLWRGKIKDVMKNIQKHLAENNGKIEIVKKEESLLYKYLDKAAKKKVLHKNKAARLKSRFAKMISAYEDTKSEKSTKTKKATRKPRAKSTSKSKSN